MLKFFKKVQEEKKGTNGITLVALVVTIVILLILAGVTIATITGDNGILGKVGEAKEQTDLAQLREEIVLLWNETQIDITGKGYTNEEIANIFEEKLKENDPNATVTYQPINNTYEVNYKDHMFEVQPGGELTNNRQDVIDDVKDAWENVDKDVTGEDKAEQIEDELQKKDPNSSAEYNPETGNTDVNHGGYEVEVDEDGNVTIKGPEEEPTVDIDTDGDGEPDINIDTDDDGEPDINIDTDGDKEPDINIDTDDDGKPDVNVDTDGDKKPDINIDTDDDGDADINIDTNGDKKPDINIDTDEDGDPDLNIDKDGDKNPDVNVDTDGDGEPDINIDTNEDGEPDINIDTNGDKKPDINIDTDDDGDADINIDTNGDKKPDINIDTDEDGDPDLNIDKDGDKNPDVNVDTDNDGEPDINIDTNDDGEPDINIDTNGDKKPDINIDTDDDGEPELNIDKDGDKNPDVNVDTDNDGESDINIDTNEDGEPDINIDTNGDKKPDINIDTDDDGDADINIDTNGDKKPDINIDTDDDGEPELNIDKDGDKNPDVNVDTDNDSEPDINIDTNEDGEPDINIDTNGDKKPDVNIDTDDDGEPDINIDTNGDKKPDINIDTDDDGTPDLNIDDNDDGIPDRNIDTDNDGEPEVNIDDDLDGTIDRNEDTDGDKIPDINIDTDDDGTPDIDIDTNGDKVADKNVTKLAIAEQPVSVETISGTENVSFSVKATGAASAGSTEKETITYQWYYSTTGNNTDGTPIDEATSSTYTINKEDVTTDISGRYYYCVVTQNYRNKTNVETTQVALLTVISPVEVTSQPTSVQTIEGANDVTFTVGGSGNGDLSYQWYYKTSQSGEENVVTGANGETYTIPKEEVTTDLNGRYYYAKVTQSYGTAVATATSSEALLSVVEKAKITKEPAAVTVAEGEKATFEVEAIGLGEFSYQWYKNITNSTTGGTPIGEATGNTYTIETTKAEDNDTYYYVVITQNYEGSIAEITSSAAKLTVGEAVSVSIPSDVDVIAGVTEVAFTVEASGSGTFSYQWYKKTTDSNQGGTIIDSATGNTYTIPKEEVTADLNETYYYVEVIQSYGGKTSKVVSEAAKLSVEAPVEITANLQPVTAYENGTNVVFSVTTTGEGTVTYQWYKNNTNSNEGGEEIPGAVGNTYTIPKEEVTTDLNGTYYYVVVTQKYGSSIVTVTSAPALLTVLATTIEASETDVTTYVNGNSKTVTLSGENAGTFSVVTPADTSYATAEINESNNKELIITPIAEGETSVIVQEGNGGKTVTINIHVVKTTITASPENVIAYVGGSSQTVTLGGENTEEFDIQESPDGTYATADIVGNILTITPVAKGETKVVVKELNGNETITIKIEVKETSIDANNKNIIAYVNGKSQTVEIIGDELGELSVTTEPEGIVTTSIEENTLTITPVAEGTTNVVVTEGNGGKTVTIVVEVRETSIDATNKNVTAYVDGTPQNIEITGDNLGTLSVTTEPEGVVTTSIKENTLTITPVAEGITSITVTEGNGGKTVTIEVEVKTVTMAPSTNEVTAYVGGADQEVTMTGTNVGNLVVVSNPESTVATVSVSEDKVIIHPVGQGTTSVTIEEGNSKKQATINIEVIESTIIAEPTSITAYAGGTNQTVTIKGTDIGGLTILEEPEETVATAILSGQTLTITPKAAGSTSVTVKESNGNKTAKIDITVLATSITPQTVELFAGGVAKSITIEGLNMGNLEISTPPTSSIATASINGKTLTVTPVAAGNTNLTLKESNGNATATITINVLPTSITASPTSVTANVGDGAQTVTLGGTNHGDFTVVTQPNTAVATVSISGSTLTVTPVSAGNTTVVVKEGNGNKQTTIGITIKAELLAEDVLVPNKNGGTAEAKSPYVKYNNQTWRVLYNDESHGLQLISADNVKDLEIGAYTIGDQQIFQGMLYMVFNAAVTKFHDEVQTYKGNTAIDVRCVGGVATLSNGKFNLEDNAGTRFYMGYIFKNADDNYKEDAEQIKALGINATSDTWLASREIYQGYEPNESVSYVLGRIRTIQKSGEISSNDLVGVAMGQTIGTDFYTDIATCGLRPVILMPSDAKITSGSGSSADPYIIK